ncbi:hypothetical protein BDZ91DRAFT_766369 [Kalaharituber pfeilii]|nr:hypothetical protein BDZ91DRAFT_766369 [Kalaharituber pfeilii]
MGRSSDRETLRARPGYLRARGRRGGVGHGAVQAPGRGRRYMLYRPLLLSRGSAGMRRHSYACEQRAMGGQWAVSCAARAKGLDVPAAGGSGTLCALAFPQGPPPSSGGLIDAKAGALSLAQQTRTSHHVVLAATHPPRRGASNVGQGGCCAGSAQPSYRLPVRGSPYAPASQDALSNAISTHTFGLYADSQGPE